MGSTLSRLPTRVPAKRLREPIRRVDVRRRAVTTRRMGSGRMTVSGTPVVRAARVGAWADDARCASEPSGPRSGLGDEMRPVRCSSLRCVSSSPLRGDLRGGSPRWRARARARTAGVALIAGLAVAGCAQAPVDAGMGSCEGPRFIIKLAGEQDATLPGTVRSLSDDARIALSYRRTLATGAHVYCGAPVSEGRAAAAVERLARSPDVRYVELGRAVRAR